MNDIIPLSTDLDLVFWAWCAFLGAIWLITWRWIGYRRFNTFTIYLPMLFVTNGLFVPLSRSVNPVISLYHISPEAFANYWLAVALTFLCLPVGVSLANLFRRREPMLDPVYVARPRSVLRTRLFLIGVVALSVVSLVQIYALGLNLDLQAYFGGFVSSEAYSAHRYGFAAATTGWAFYLYTKLPYAIAPMANVMLATWGGISRIASIGALLIIAFAIVQSGHKLPLVVLISTVVLSRGLFRTRLVIRRSIVIASVLICGIVIFAIVPWFFFTQGFTGSYQDALYWSIERHVIESYRSLQLYFEVFPQYHDFLYGQSVRAMAALAGANTLSVSQYIPNVFLDVDNTSYPALFIGEAWADFGFAGVVVWSLALSFLLQMYNVWYFSRRVRYLEDTALLVTISFATIHLLASNLVATASTYGLATNAIIWLGLRGVTLRRSEGTLRQSDPAVCLQPEPAR